MSESRRPASYHVLLIGVDDYQTRPLRGCVNDIDAVQAVLLGPRLGVPDSQIRRLVARSPGDPGLPGLPHAAVAEAPATLANLRAALAELASERVARRDRVFIYYAGHGARVAVRASNGRRFHREAMVMADHDPATPDSGMLYDFELNQALRKIAERTSSVALVLDCCHAAGVTRGPTELLPQDVVAATDPVARCLDLDRVAEVPDPLGADVSADEPLRPLLAAADHCHVVAACLGHERANEDGGRDGVRHGVLTRAFLAALDEVPDIALADLTWGRIWQPICAAVSQRNPAQHPRMTGSAGRAVFAGPPVEHDPGIPIRALGQAFEIAAGTLASVTRGAVIAVYGEQPHYFPPLDSDADHRARIGLVRVQSADRTTATAVAEGRAFELPPDARGRLIAAGESARLRCAVIPPHAPIEARLRESPLLEVVSQTQAPDVQLEYGRGRWFVTDSLYSMQPDRPLLFALHQGELDCVRRVMEHYAAYSVPLRMAARLTDLEGSLDLRVRIVSDVRETNGNRVQGGNSQHLAATTFDTYVLREATRVCFEVRNHSPHRLRVTLVNSAASGKVQFLGDETIDAGAQYVFYANTGLGEPFSMVLPPGIHHGLDRVIAIGRTAHGHDLGYLRVDQTFAGTVNLTRSGGSGDTGDRRFGDRGGKPGAAPLEQWTVAQAIIETHR